MTPHEEHPQGRPRIKSLDKDSFYFEQGGQEKNEEREIMALLRKGCSRDWREVLCAWERRGREVEREDVKLYPSFYTLPLGPSSAFTGQDPTTNFQLWDGDQGVGVRGQCGKRKNRGKRIKRSNERRKEEGNEGFSKPQAHNLTQNSNEETEFLFGRRNKRSPILVSILALFFPSPSLQQIVEESTKEWSGAE